MSASVRASASQRLSKEEGLVDHAWLTRDAVVSRLEDDAFQTYVDQMLWRDDAMNRDL